MSTRLVHGTCGKRYVQRGERTSHCGGSGTIAVPLWPATFAWPGLDASTFECSPDGRGISANHLADRLSAVTEAVEPLGLVRVDPVELRRGLGATPVLSMLKRVFFRRENAQVARIVVGAVSVDVVDVLAVFRASNEAVLIALDVLDRTGPSEPDIAVARDVAQRTAVWWFFASPQLAYGLGVRAEPKRSASVAPPALPGGIGDDGLAIDTDNVHTLTIQWYCHETFATLSAFERHRRDNACLDPAETTKRDGTPAFTLDNDGYWALPLTDANRRRHETWLNQLRQTRTGAEQGAEVPVQGAGDSEPPQPAATIQRGTNR